MIKNRFIKWLQLPEVEQMSGYNLSQFVLLREKIIESKEFLKKLYSDFYQDIKKRIPQKSGLFGRRIIIEIGSDGGFIEKVIPETITSDVIFLPEQDLVLSAMELPFKDDSVHAFVLINVLHHIPTPYKFLKEAERCLRRQGKIIMIEPSCSLWAKFVYKNFHYEPFYPNADWRNPNNPIGTNGAMPWIIFCRDKIAFEKEFPMLKIHNQKQHTPLRYILSGGVSMRQILPSFTYSYIKGLEILVSFISRYFSMFMTIEVEKI